MNFPPEMIGVGKYTGELAAFLQAQGHRVEVVTALPHYPGFVSRDGSPWRYRQTIEQGVSITRCPLVLRKGGRGFWRLAAPLSFALTSAPVLLWRALRTRPDVVLCVEPTLLAAPAALLAARLCGARTALHVQDLEVDAAFATAHLRGRSLRRAAEAIERLTLQRFDGVITISDAMAGRLARKGVPSERLSVARNWLATAQRTAFDFRAALGIPPQHRVVLYAGSLGAKQGIPVLLAALRRLAGRPGLHVVIAGEGPMAGAVAGAAATMPNVVALPLQPADRLGALLAMADLHLLPQSHCAADLVFPSKLGALLATGRPLVVTANPGTELARWLTGAATLVAADDPTAFAAAIEAVLDGSAVPDPARALALAQSLDAGLILPAIEATLGQLLDPAGTPATDMPWAFGTPTEAIAPLSG